MRVLAAAHQAGGVFLHAGYGSAWGTAPENPDGLILLIASGVAAFLVLNFAAGLLFEKSRFKIFLFGMIILVVYLCLGCGVRSG